MVNDRRGHNAARKGSGEVGFQPRRLGKNAPTPSEHATTTTALAPPTTDTDTPYDNLYNEYQQHTKPSNFGMDKDVFTTKYDTMRERIKKINDELEKGVESLRNSENYMAFLNQLSVLHKYSLNNTMMITIQNPEATMVAGYRTWKKLGRYVKKGSQGIAIQVPHAKNREDENGNPILDNDGNPIKDTYFGIGHVYDVSQTDGEPLVENPTQRLTGEAPPEYQQKLENAITKMGYTIVRKDLGPHTNGLTDPVTKTVTISTRLSSAQTAKTTAHELGHILAGHGDNMDEYSNGQCRGKMEVVAESISYVLCRDAGMDPGGYSFGYIESWGSSSGQPSTQVIRESSETVANAVKKAFKLLEDSKAEH